MAYEPSFTVSLEGNQNSDNLILDTHVSSNLPTSPRGTDIRNSSGSKMPVVSCMGTSVQQYPIKGVVDGALVMVKEAVECHAKEGSDLSNETLFQGSLAESKEGISNILQNKEEIIKGFIIALVTRVGEIGEKTPSAKGERSDICKE
ncbi:hypothetical protein HAX54_025431 [Datura stramonium]|uniref:Uncharacterized protein n=1 Tax=Datura stramonium TaxID=4076 RepID=A0ABS8V2C0_DATST|nr:hypothetical protein [Datura stramonium]